MVKIRAQRIDHELPFRQDPCVGIVQADTVIGVIFLLGELFGIANVGTPPHRRTQHVIDPPDMIEFRALAVVRIVILRDIHEILPFHSEVIKCIEFLGKIAVEKKTSALAPQETFI